MAADDDVTSGVHGFFLFLYHPTYGTGTSTLSLHDALPISEGRSIDVHVQKFEDVALKPASFDLVVSATTLDRKSTRLNSSHLGISYAVFCLKKKRRGQRAPPRPAGQHAAIAFGPARHPARR